MPFATIPFEAGGSIAPSIFVKVSTAADFKVLAAGANDAVIGISSAAAHDAPLSGASTTAAESGDSLEVHPIGSVALLQAGSGGWTRGDELKSDSSGYGVTRATTGTTVQNVGAIALESASEGEFGRVLVIRTSIRPALT